MKCLFSFFHPNMTYDGLLWNTKKCTALMFFQTCMTYFFLWKTKNDILKNFGGQTFLVTFLNKSSFVRREGHENNMRVRKLQNFQFWMNVSLNLPAVFRSVLIWQMYIQMCGGGNIYKNTHYVILL